MVLNCDIIDNFVKDLDRRASECELDSDDWQILIDALMQEKDKCIVIDNKYIALSIALTWAIGKRKEAFLGRIKQ